MKEYFIKSPTVRNKRKTFAIVERTTDENGVHKNRTLNDDRINTINKSLLSGEHTTVYLRAQLKDLVNEFRGQAYPEKITANNPENLKIFDRFWAEEYEHRRIVDKTSAKNEFLRAVRILGNLSLMTADSNSLQRQINSLVKGPKQRRTVAAIRTILRYLGRADVKLTLDNKTYPEIKYLSEADLNKVITKLPWFDALLARAAFYSGGRLGELFALESINFSGYQLQINSQIKLTGDKALPKRQKRRRAYVPAPGREWVSAWCSIPLDEKLAMRKREYSRIIQKACREAFPTIPSKHVSFHDLRHSYAIYCLSNEVNLSLVAQSLGNGEKVCQDHYSGYSANDATLAAMDAIFQRRK